MDNQRFLVAPQQLVPVNPNVKSTSAGEEKLHAYLLALQLK